jgi:hypothetical protein
MQGKSTAQNMALLDLWLLICELARHDRIRAVNQLHGPWVRSVGDWTLAINGHEEKILYDCGGEMRVMIDPYECALFHYDRFVGKMTPQEGVMCDVEGANFDTLSEALRQEIHSEPGKP